MKTSKRHQQLYSKLIKLGQVHGFILITPNWINVKTQYKWKCKNGHIFSKYIRQIKYKNSGCQYCAGYKITISDCHDLAQKRKGKCLSTEYINNCSNLKWQCEFGDTWEATLNSVKSSKSWCPTCAGSAKPSIEDCHILAKAKNGKFLSNEYKNNITKMLWECGKGHRFKATWNHINNYNSWCPRCVHFISKGEDEIYKFILQFFPDAEQNKPGYLRNKRFRLDTYIPSLKKAIEFDGTYWHSLPSSIERDARKDKECDSLGIKLFRIKEKDFIANPENVKRLVIEFLKE